MRVTHVRFQRARHHDGAMGEQRGRTFAEADPAKYMHLPRVVGEDAAEAAAADDRPAADIEQLQAVAQARARIAAEQVPQGTPNELAARRGAVPPPVFESVAQRMHWLMGQARVRELSVEEQDSLAQFKRAQPSSYRRMQELVDEQRVRSSKEDDPGRLDNGTGSV